MTQRPAIYQVAHGLPDSHEFYSWETRRDMAQGISCYLELLESDK